MLKVKFYILVVSNWSLFVTVEKRINDFSHKYRCILVWTFPLGFSFVVETSSWNWKVEWSINHNILLPGSKKH